jgi:hypothetical protein
VKMGKLWARGALVCVLSALSFAAAVAPAGANSNTNISSFSDPRGDMPNHAGQLTRSLYGPYTIPAASSSNNMLGEAHNQIVTNLTPPCTNCRITDIVPTLVFSNDGVTPTSTANLDDGVMLHHVVMTDPSKTDQGCTGGFPLGQRFFAAGNERSHTHLPSNYGFDQGTSTWDMVYHLANRTTAQQTVYVQVVYRWRATSANDSRPATPVWLDIDGCGFTGFGTTGDSDYTIPTGYSDAHSSWTSTLSGYVITIGGHQHDLDITNAVQSDRCTNHCGAQTGEARAVSAEVVGGDPNVYYGPTPPNNTPPSDLTGATLCRSEGYLGHLDTMSGCGVFSDPTTHQAEAYPLTGAAAFPGYYLKQGQVVKLHSEYDNNTGSSIDDAMGIMVMWIGQASYARPAAGAAFRVPLVPAYNSCAAAAANRSHGASLNMPSCNPSVQTSSYLTVGTTDANGFPSNAGGFLKMNVCATGTTTSGTCSTPAGMTSPDVRMELRATDVRCKTGVSTCEGGQYSDYLGQLGGNLTLRITDKQNAPSGGSAVDDATAQDLPFRFTAQCAASGTNDTTQGATCSVVTRLNALSPGAAANGKRGNWELAKVDVTDGGSDGSVGTTGNTLFQTQGIFVP